MAIKTYTNFEQINSRIENEGKYLNPQDLFIVTKKEIEISEFGESEYDVMEVSIYDVNNNLLPQKSGKNVSYIKSGDIKNYVYNITNKSGQKELAIDGEKILNSLGFNNGIFKININFVRNRVGSDNELARVWIQEISSTREEVRILPLKTNNEFLSNVTKNEFRYLINQTKDFKFVKKYILENIEDFSKEKLIKINDTLVAKFGNEFFSLLKNDFGVSSFDTFKNKIFSDYQTSVGYYLSNKYYDIEKTNFGKPLPNPIFNDNERYDYKMITDELEKILYKCVSSQIKLLKRRSLDFQTLPQEFSVVQLQKSISDNLSSFEVPITNTTDVYSPSLAQIKLKQKTEQDIIRTPTSDPNIRFINIEQPVRPGPPRRTAEPIIVTEEPIEPPVDFSPPNPENRDADPLPVPDVVIIGSGPQTRGSLVDPILDTRFAGGSSGGGVILGQDRNTTGRDTGETNLLNRNEQ